MYPERVYLLVALLRENREEFLRPRQLDTGTAHLPNHTTDRVVCLDERARHAGREPETTAIYDRACV